MAEHAEEATAETVDVDVDVDVRTALNRKPQATPSPTGGGSRRSLLRAARKLVVSSSRPAKFARAPGSWTQHRLRSYGKA